MSVNPRVGPLLVFGPRSLDYDFGPGHPLTPLRFGPGIDLLRSVGAQPGLAPEPATDDDLLEVHARAYLETVRSFSEDPGRDPAMGIGISDNPPFAGMHDAAAAVAAGSLRAMDAILGGDVEHALHPGGGLHHAMPARASGFCIYDDPALAVARARRDGCRVLYVDLDVHHGDGVQAIHAGDQGVLTVSFHESGAYLFPGTGFPHELGEGAAAGTSVNMPFEPYTGETAWLAAIRALVPSLAAVFGPDVVVSQHGADTHAWDPLAQLRVTTTAMAEAARIVDAVAHRWAGGRWLATGGGGYDAYRVVPRAWALTWLAGAHREPPDETPPSWRDRWSPDASAFGTPGMPPAFIDAPNAGRPVEAMQAAAEQHSLDVLARVRASVLPRLVVEAEDRGWWRPALAWAGREVVVATRTQVAAAPEGRQAGGGTSGDGGSAPVIRSLDAGDLDKLALAERAIPPFDPVDGRALLAAAVAGGARVVAAISGSTIVGAAVAAPGSDPGTEALLVVGVAPRHRRAGLGTALLRALADERRPGVAIEARIGVAERDVVEPLPVETRVAVGRRLLESAGFEAREGSRGAARIDRWAVAGRLAAR